MTTTERSPTRTPAAARLASAPPEPVAPGSRWESAWLALLLAGDLLSTPFHLVAFLCTRRRQRRALLEALQKAAR